MKNLRNIKLTEVEKTLDRQEQYSRRNCLLVHKVDEKHDEDTEQTIINTVKNDLGEENMGGSG